MEAEDDTSRAYIFSNGLKFSKFTRVAAIGGERQILESDIPRLPRSQLCSSSLLQFKEKIRASQKHAAYLDKKSSYQLATRYFKCIWMFQYTSIINLNIIKLLACILSFAGPIILGLFVEYFDEAKDVSVGRGLMLLFLLLSTQILSAVLSCQYSILASKMETQVKGALMLAVFRSSVSIKMHEMKASGLSNALVINALQIDIERSVETVKSFIDLWEIPLQMCIAFALLYLQVSFAFIAGVATIVLMIPVNSFIAREIGKAAGMVMKHKDSRISLLAEAFKGILGLKSGGLEEEIQAVSSVHRADEIRNLARKKYLDAICVFLWASMPLIVPYATFMSSVAIGNELSASKVLVTITLLNMLMFPMNAFPWVINNVMEGGVSAARVMRVLLAQPKDSLFSTNDSSTVISPLMFSEGLELTQPHMSKNSKTAYSVAKGNVDMAPLSSGLSYSSSSVREFSLSGVVVSWDSSESSDNEESPREEFRVGPVTFTCSPGQILAIVGVSIVISSEIIPF